MIDALAGVPTVVVIGLTDIDVDVLVDVSLNLFSGVMSVEFVTPASFEVFSC